MNTTEHILELLDTKFREATLHKFRFARNKQQGSFYSEYADNLAALIILIQDEEVDEYGLSFRIEELA